MGSAKNEVLRSLLTPRGPQGGGSLKGFANRSALGSPGPAPSGAHSFLPRGPGPVPWSVRSFPAHAHSATGPFGENAPHRLVR